jgi:hypothetical protein
MQHATYITNIYYETGFSKIGIHVDDMSLLNTGNRTWRKVLELGVQRNMGVSYQGDKRGDTQYQNYTSYHTPHFLISIISLMQIEDSCILKDEFNTKR